MRAGVLAGVRPVKRPKVQVVVRADALVGVRAGILAGIREGEPPGVQPRAQAGEQAKARTDAQSGLRDSERPGVRALKKEHSIRLSVPDRVLSSNRPGTTCGHFKILQSSDHK